MSLFKEDLDLIKQTNPDLVDMFESGKYGEVVIKPTDLRDSKDTKYRFFIDSGTTVKKDEMIESETVNVLLDKVMNIPGAPQQVAATGVVKLGTKIIDVGELFKRTFITSGIQDWEKIVKDDPIGANGVSTSVDSATGPTGPVQGQPPVDAAMGQTPVPPTPGMPQSGGSTTTPPIQGQAMPQVNFEQPQARGAFQQLSPESESLLASLSGKK